MHFLILVASFVLLMVCVSVSILAYRSYLRTPVVIRDFKRARLVLASHKMDPSPRRLNDPRSKDLYLNKMMRLMLLYNEEFDHARLLELYPKMNSYDQLAQSYGPFIKETIEDLLDHAGKKFEFMNSVAILLPWLVIAEITGMPTEDINNAIKYTEQVGNYIGRRYSPERFEM